MERNIKRGFTFIKKIAAKYKNILINVINPNVKKTIDKENKKYKVKYKNKKKKIIEMLEKKKCNEEYKEKKKKELYVFLVDQEKELDFQENSTFCDKYLYDKIDKNIFINEKATNLKDINNKNEKLNENLIDKFQDKLNPIDFNFNFNPNKQYNYDYNMHIHDECGNSSCSSNYNIHNLKKNILSPKKKNKINNTSELYSTKKRIKKNKKIYNKYKNSAEYKKYKNKKFEKYKNLRKKKNINEENENENKKERKCETDLDYIKHYNICDQNDQTNVFNSINKDKKKHLHYEKENETTNCINQNNRNINIETNDVNYKKTNFFKQENETENIDEVKYTLVFGKFNFDNLKELHCYQNSSDSNDKNSVNDENQLKQNIENTEKDNIRNINNIDYEYFNNEDNYLNKNIYKYKNNNFQNMNLRYSEYDTFEQMNDENCYDIFFNESLDPPSIFKT